MTTRSALAETIGQAHADALSKIAGGTRISVPSSINAPTNGGRNGFERLAGTVGHDLALLLVLHYGGTQIGVPRGLTGRRVDIAKVAELTNAGMSASKIARALHCTERTVFTARAKAQAKGWIGLAGPRKDRS